MLFRSEGARDERGNFRVLGVYRGSPADNAGISDGDLIGEINGTLVSEMSDSALASMMSGFNSGTVKMTLLTPLGQRRVVVRRATIVIADADVVFMDDDGQHDSSFIPAMINKIDEGFDIVYADFEEKKQAKWKTFGSNFHQLTSEWLEEKPKGVHTSSFFVVKRYLVEELKKYPSPSPVIFGYLMKMTQNITSIPVPHKTRINGRSGYTLKKLIKLWLNAVTSFSVVPLRVSSYLGFLSAGIGIVALIIIVIRKLLHPEIAAGYTSTIAVILLFAGILLLMMGLVGEYIGGMFMTVNHVPQYVIKEVVGDKKKGDKKCMKI